MLKKSILVCSIFSCLVANTAIADYGIVFNNDNTHSTYTALQNSGSGDIDGNLLPWKKNQQTGTIYSTNGNIQSAEIDVTPVDGNGKTFRYILEDKGVDNHCGYRNGEFDLRNADTDKLVIGTICAPVQGLSGTDLVYLTIRNDGFILNM